MALLWLLVAGARGALKTGARIKVKAQECVNVKLGKATIAAVFISMNRSRRFPDRDRLKERCRGCKF